MDTWVGIAVVVGIAIALIFLIIHDFENNPGGRMKKICRNYGIEGFPMELGKGSLIIELFLWIVGLFTLWFLAVAFIYTVWRSVRLPEGCPACSHPGMIPIDSPVAKNILGK